MHLLHNFFQGWLYLNAAWTGTALISIICLTISTKKKLPFKCPCGFKLEIEEPEVLRSFEKGDDKYSVALIVITIVFVLQFFGVIATKYLIQLYLHKKKCLVYQVKGRGNEDEDEE